MDAGAAGNAAELENSGEDTASDSVELEKPALVGSE